MARRNNPETGTPPGQPPGENPARAAFEAWKRRAESQAGNVGGGMGLHAGQPFMPPGPYAMPGWGYPPPPPPWPQPQPPVPFAGPEPEGPPADRTSSLVEGIGSLLRLGIEVLNAGLAGGLQMVEGMGYAGGYYGWDYPEHGLAYAHPYADDYGRYGHHDYSHHHYGHCGCNPSVHNCG